MTSFNKGCAMNKAFLSGKAHGSKVYIYTTKLGTKYAPMSFSPLQWYPVLPSPCSPPSVSLYWPPLLVAQCHSTAPASTTPCPYCTAPHCTALHCIALHCNALQSTSQWFVLQCSVLCELSGSGRKHLHCDNVHCSAQHL